ncbi:MAG: dephospho-CoA kinase [Bacteroidota bacterium]|nr:dephospho-CoA kinase [Bacteroidota bacterium]
MKVIGLTGGIGSGKTTVAGFFKEMGIPVYIADDAGKRLLATSEKIRRQVIAIFGEEAYTETGPNRTFIASKVFHDKELLEKLNAIIHPAVASDFENWLQEQESAYVLYEAAILFETGGYRKCDQSILVTAPREQRIERLLERDQTSEAAIQARMDNQWSDERKRELANFVIENINLDQTRKQVELIHTEILKAGQNS